MIRVRGWGTHPRTPYKEMGHPPPLPLQGDGGLAGLRGGCGWVDPTVIVLYYNSKIVTHLPTRRLEDEIFLSPGTPLRAPVFLRKPEEVRGSAVAPRVNVLEITKISLFLAQFSNLKIRSRRYKGGYAKVHTAIRSRKNWTLCEL